MEDVGWKRDETPYLIFNCSKCKQFSYVKTTQRTKECLRCGRQHKVSNIINSGEIVKGMTTAVETVKTRQNELAIKDLGKNPELRASDEFTVVSSPKKKPNFDTIQDTNDLISKFEKMLHEISDSYTEFPFYVFEIMAENFGIPLSELKILIKNFLKKGFLIGLKDKFFKIMF